MSATGIAEWALSGAILAAVGWQFVRFVVDEERRAQLQLRALRRAPRAERAALEAALVEPAFAPERIRSAVDEILELAAAVWSGHGSRLKGRADGLLIAAWARQRVELLGPGLTLRGRVRTDLMRVVNRERREEDLVVVRLRFGIRRSPELPWSERLVRTDERWQLARTAHGWRLASVVGDPVARALTSSSLIASPDRDEGRLREASLQELSGHVDLRGISPGELTDGRLTPDLQLRDLALVDDRFSPLLIEAALTHIVEAWEEASDDSRQELRRIATRWGAGRLTVEGTSGTYRFVRDASLRSWRVQRVQADRDPPRISVDVRVRGVFYFVPMLFARGARVSGNDRDPTTIDLRWKLALTEDGDGHPRWRLDDCEHL